MPRRLRAHRCVPASDARELHVIWTMSGQPADEGEFTLIDIPIWTTFAVLYRVGDGPYTGSGGTFDGGGNLTLDLRY